MERICENCKWYTFEEIDRGYVCVNADSPYVTEWVGAKNRCDEWELVRHCPTCKHKDKPWHNEKCDSCSVEDCNWESDDDE